MQPKVLSPNIYIVAGPNGVGKTTFAREFLPKYADCKNFVNADLIAAGLAPFAPQSAALRAGRLVLNEIESFANQQVDFGFESTLAGRSYVRLIQRLKDRGYAVHIYFLSVPTDDILLSRVKDRVRMGGHDVPEADIRRRFSRSIANFLRYYCLLANSWILFDNSAGPPAVIASRKQDGLRIIEKEIYNSLLNDYGDR